MSKRKYKATHVKSVDWTTLNQRLQERPLTFAVDAAKTGMYGTVMTEEKAVLVTLKWQHPQETGEVIKHLTQDIDSTHRVMVIEPSSTYGDPLVYQFEQAGMEVYRVSPKKTYDAKEIYDGVPSLHDAKSAYVIGRLHLEGNSQRWLVQTAQRRTLRALFGVYESYQSSYQRQQNRLEARLARHWPEVLSLLSLDSVTLEALLIRYGSPQAISLEPASTLQLMQRVSRGRLHLFKREQLLDSASHTVGVPCIEAECQALQALAEELQRLRLLSRRAKSALEQASAQDPCSVAMSRVVGKLTAAVLMVTQGLPGDYASASSYLKSLGLNLKEKSSGRHQGRLRLSKRGPGLARKYLYFAAMRLVQQEPLVRAWYKRKVQRDGGTKMKALIAVMRKLAKALWHVGQGEPFDARRLFNTHLLVLPCRRLAA